MAMVSIIIPVLNAQNNIDQCLASVLSQTCTELEVLLMVGICSDNSLERCVEWQKKDNRIIILSRKDTSLGDARNYGLRLARGEFVAYVDIDDVIERDYIAQMAGALRKDQSADLACCGFDKVHCDGQAEKGVIPRLIGPVDMDFDTYLFTVGWGVVWTKLYRREWLIRNKLEMFDGCHEDDAMHLMLAATVKRVWFIPEILYHYHDENNSSLMHNAANRYDYPKAIAYAIAFLKERNLYSEHVRRLIKARCIFGFRQLFEEGYGSEKLVQMCRDFFKVHFPEVFLKRPQLQKGSVIFWGFGKDFKELAHLIDTEKVRYIVDGNETFQGMDYQGIPIYPADRLLEDSQKTQVVISSSQYYYEISHFLQRHGWTDYMSMKEYLAEYVDHTLLWMSRKREDRSIK